MTTKIKNHSGGCLCGAIRFELSNEPIRSLVCHCSTCRQAVGASRVAWAVVKASDFQWLGDQPSFFNSSSDVQRSFCPTCGTSLTYQNISEPSTIDITIASFDQPGLCPPQIEIWTDHKLSWDIQNPNLPQLLHDFE